MRDPATQDLGIAAQREALEARLRSGFRTLFGKGSWRIIWDGAQGAGDTDSRDGHTRFTRMPTADDAIVRAVRSANEKVTVVTSDNELAARCKQAASHGCEVLPASRAFASALPTAQKTQKKRHGGMSAIDQGIPANAKAINDELRALWCGEE